MVTVSSLALRHVLVFKSCFPRLLAAASLLASCRLAPPASAVMVPTASPAPAAAATATEARAAVSRYLHGQPNGFLYVLDSARINDNDATWQVLVPRTDWARRLPGRARFEVEKATGTVRPAPVK